MSKVIQMSAKQRTKVNSSNARGKPWVDSEGQPLDPDHICKCWDMYKSRKMTAATLQHHFPGRTIKAISSKVWKIRGRQESTVPRDYNPDQEDLFRGLLK